MKKKITAVALVVALLAVGIIGGTLAYFTDSKAQTNTFTAGNVAITLDEAKVDGEGRTAGNQSYKLYPGMEVTKDPTITVTGSEDAWIAAKITVKGDLLDLYGVDTARPRNYNNIDITKIVSGGKVQENATPAYNWNGLSMVYETPDLVIYQDASNGDNGANSEWVFYIFMNNALHKDDQIVLFEKVKVDAAFDNDEMAKLKGATVTVKAFAAQEYGFSSCFEAMTTAFPTQFNF